MVSIGKHITNVFVDVDTPNPTGFHCMYMYIFHNVLNVLMAMDYARHTHQELIVMEFDLEKTYDDVNSFFVF